MSKTIYLLIGLLISLFLWSAELQAKEKFTVVIDAGHGGKDPGAKGALINEKVINLAVALKLGEMITLNHSDVHVVYTRKTDRFIELNERANIANRNKADLFISIHANSLKKGKATVQGTETYTLGLAKTQENLEVAMLENSAILLEDNYLQRYGGFDPNSTESYIIFEFMQNKHMEQSVNFASEIQKEFKSADRHDRGVKQDRFLVLLRTSMPAVLVELGFVTNREEERFMKSAVGQDKLAKAIYNAFTKYKREYDKRLGTQNSNGVTSQNTTTKKTTSAAIPQANKDSKPSSKTTTSKTEVSKNSDIPKTSVSSQKNTTSTTENNRGQIVYKVQVLTTSKKLSSNDNKLKGYKNTDYYMEKGIYKYTVGETTSKNEITNLWNKVRKDFKDAFIIEFKDGKRIK